MVQLDTWRVALPCISASQVAESAVCSRFRLTITALRDTAAASCVQLGTFRLQCSDVLQSPASAEVGSSSRRPTLPGQTGSSTPPPAATTADSGQTQLPLAGAAAAKASFGAAIRQHYSSLIATGKYAGKEAAAAAEAVKLASAGAL